MIEAEDKPSGMDYALVGAIVLGLMYKVPHVLAGLFVIALIKESGRGSSVLSGLRKDIVTDKKTKQQVNIDNARNAELYLKRQKEELARLQAVLNRTARA